MAKTKEAKAATSSPLEKLYPLVSKLSTGDQLTLINFTQNILDEKADKAASELKLIRPAVHNN